MIWLYFIDRAHDNYQCRCLPVDNADEYTAQIVSRTSFERVDRDEYMQFSRELQRLERKRLAGGKG